MNKIGVIALLFVSTVSFGAINLETDLFYCGYRYDRGIRYQKTAHLKKSFIIEDVGQEIIFDEHKDIFLVMRVYPTKDRAIIFVHIMKKLEDGQMEVIAAPVILADWGQLASRSMGELNENSSGNDLKLNFLVNKD